MVLQFAGSALICLLEKFVTAPGVNLKRNVKSSRPKSEKCLPRGCANRVTLSALCLLHAHKPPGEGDLFCTDVSGAGVVTRH